MGFRNPVGCQLEARWSCAWSPRSRRFSAVPPERGANPSLSSATNRSIGSDEMPASQSGCVQPFTWSIAPTMGRCESRCSRFHAGPTSRRRECAPPAPQRVAAGMRHGLGPRAVSRASTACSTASRAACFSGLVHRPLIPDHYCAVICRWIWFVSTTRPSRSRWIGPSVTKDLPRGTIPGLTTTT